MSNGGSVHTAQNVWDRVKRWLFPVLLLLLVAGGLNRLLLQPDVSQTIWLVATALGFAVLIIEIAINITRGDFALDLVAAIAMAAAVALDQGLAGIIIAIMYSGGQALESFARGRVNREMNALLAATPRTDARYGLDQLEEIPVADIALGDRLLVRRGEVERKVRELMGVVQFGDTMRERASYWRDVARNAAAVKGGSSERSWNDLMNAIESLRAAKIQEQAHNVGIAS